MVLESLMDPKNAEDKPWHVLVIAFFYTFIAMFFAERLFPAQSSILTMALITFLFIPFFQKMFSFEEKKEKTNLSENLWHRHEKSILVFSAFFFGILLATSVAFTFFPEYKNSFSLQTDTIKALTGAATQDGDFMRFLTNNTKVMMLTFILSTLWGAGAVLILAWNASVIGVYIGFVIRSLGGTAESFIYGFPLGLGSIALHGVPEVVAYFIAGLAGGILSVGIMREKIGSQSFNRILKDAGIFIIGAEVLIIAAAYLESYF